MTNAVEFAPEWRLTWVVSPLQESPYVEDFELWDEVQDRVLELENTCDAFDLDLCQIERI